MTPLKSIPTNIITGFLGVGKTTAILHLLANKPADERWAVLVNEFGEIGIDGSILEQQGKPEQGVFIREVPGGCMCCTSGLPMQIALNMLISKAKPDRLLIEPTGLGHPKEVLESLHQEQYRDVLSIERTVTMVDARKIQDARYTEHQTFQQQLLIADVIVANKSDLYQPEDMENLKTYLSGLLEGKDVSCYPVSQGAIELEWLSGEANYLTQSAHHHHHSSSEPDPLPAPGEKGFPESGVLSRQNKGEGFVSKGWVFDSRYCFELAALRSLFHSVDLERLKGLFITDEGPYMFNLVDGVLTEQAIDDAMETRVEVIADSDELLVQFSVGLEKSIGQF